MERLTKKERNWDGTGISKEPLAEEACLTRYVDKVLTKLADLEDAEENGRLIVLPCNIVWTITDAGKKYAGIVPRFIQELTLYEIYGIDECGKDFSSKEAALEGLRNIRERK